MNEIEITVPACVKLRFAKKMSRKCKISGKSKRQKVIDWHNVFLNFNKFRNWNHYFSNDVKKKFTEVIFEQVQSIPKMKKIVQIEYTLLRTTNRRCDRMNVYSIVDKFFCDALQKYEKIEDDSDAFIEKIIFNQTEKIEGKEEDIAVRVKIIYE